MRGITTKVAAGVVALGLAASVAACSSSSSSDKKPVGSFSTLTGNTTTVVPAASFTSALTSLGVKLGLEGTAKMTSQGIAFPITGGNATIYKKGAVKPYVQGTIDHQGSGLTLSAGGTTVTIENFVIHPGNASVLDGEVLVDGKVFAASAPLFTLAGSTLKTPTIKNGVATLSGTTIYVSPTAAGALNTAFKLTGTSKALPTAAKKIEVGYAIIEATGK